MRTWWFFLLLPSLLAAPRTGGRVCAQETASPAAEQPPSLVVEEAKPSGYYLRNEKGELVYVPDISFEQYEQMLKMQRNLANPQRPAFIIADMAMDGSVVGNRLELDVQFTLQGEVLEGVEPGTWFHVPLCCDNAVLRKEPVFEGPGGHYLTFDSAHGGYVCWLQTGGEATHKATLHLLVPVEQVGNESQATISAPLPLASSLRLRIPEKFAQGVIGDLAGADGHPLAFETTPDGQGQFVARGIRGNVRLNWHAAQSTEEPVDVRLDVRGVITVTADEMLQEVSADGHFLVRGFSGPIDSFHVRLPPGMRLRESPEPGYQVRVLPPESPGVASEQVIEVHLDRPATSKEIRLVAEVPTTQDDPAWPLTVARLIDQSEAFEPARFEFAGAVRHRGHIDVVIHGDWALEDHDDPDFPRVDWAPDNRDDADFPRVDPETAPSGPNEVAARFRYHNQERALKVSIRPKATRIRVEPTYEVSIDSQQARLRATLVCSTSGSKAAPLAIRLPFWTVEFVRFVGVDSSLPMELTETSPLVVPIPAQAQAKRKFTLEIEARLDLTASVVSGTGPLRVVLPLLEATNPSRANVIVSPATVRLIPADNVMLTPRPQQMKALSPLIMPSTVAGAGTPNAPASTPETGAAAGSSGGREVAPFCYRDRGSSEQAVFVGDIKIQPQAISVTVASTATLSRTSLLVEQRLSYVVLHEPVEMLTFTLPAALTGEAGAGWRLSLADEPLIPSFEPGVGSERSRARVRLPKPMLGPLEVRVVHTRQPMPELSNEGLSRLSIPLVFPATRSDSNTTIVDNTLTVLREEPMHVAPADGAWVVEASESGAGKLVLVTSAEGADPVLQLSLRGSSPAGTTVAHQIWIQSWLTNGQRRDRAVFKVSTREPQLVVTLPQLTETEVRLVKVAVDQSEMAVDEPGPRGEVSVPIPPGPAAASEHVVEVWYDVLASGHNAYGQLSLAAATLDAQDRVDRMYWQVILPRGEVVVSRDSRLTAELQWQWGQFGWRRYPSQDQADLEQWIDASRQAPVPVGTNQYLFTTFGATSQLELTTASRSLILLVCSGISLIGGLVLLYCPLLRQPALLFAAGIVTATLGLLVPELAILFAQAALLGMLLALTARVFRQWLWRSHALPPMVQGRAQFSDSKIKANETVLPRVDGSSRITATSPPASVQVSAADSKL